MNVLMISTDRNLFDKNSEARQRIFEYGKLVDGLHVVIFSKKGGFEIQNSGNVFLYPTNSKNKLFYVFDAIRIGSEIIGTGAKKWFISCQDAFECGLSGYFISRKTKISLQLQIHTDFLSPYFKKESFLNRIRVFVAKFLIPRANCIRTVSQRIKKSVVLAFPEIKIPIIILPIFVDIEKIIMSSIKMNLHEKYPQFKFIILMASRFTEEKNINLAIGAMKSIITNHQDAGLIIVGDGPKKKEIESKIENCRLRANIKIEPWNKDLASYYKTADLYVLTSNYEGYGRSIIEAMAAGCPVVMTDVGIAGEILVNKKDGIIIPAMNENKLAEAINNLIENKNLRASLAENSKKIMDFWPKKENHLKLYRDSWISCA